MPTLADRKDDRVRFAPNPRWPNRKIEARVVRRRRDPRSGKLTWIDTVDDAGVERSVRPSRCETV